MFSQCVLFRTQTCATQACVLLLALTVIEMMGG